MKVKIIKCSNYTYWYNNLIGITVDVIENNTGGFMWLTPKELKIYGVKHPNSIGLGISYNDCIIINRKEKLLRILNI